MTKIKTIDIEIAIMREFNYRQNLIVPNITSMYDVLDFETDMLVLTKANLAYGFEIKISKSDLKKDFEKIQHKNINYFRKFKYFYYAIPSELVEYAQTIIPSHFGIWALDINERGFKRFYEVRKPVKLFDHYFTNSQRYEIARLGAMRIYTLKLKLA